MSTATAVAPFESPVTSQLAGAFGVSFALGNPKVPDGLRVGQMRRIARAHLRLWSIPESVEEKVVLAVSELITNAIEHGVEDNEDDRAICLRALYASGRLLVEVADGNPSPAVLRYADDDEDSGRGLFLVAVFAEDWGVSEDGETTWCEFDVPVGRR